MKDGPARFAVARFFLWICFCVEGVLFGVMVSYLFLDLEPWDWRFYLIPSVLGPGLAWAAVPLILRLYVLLKTRISRPRVSRLA